MAGSARADAPQPDRVDVTVHLKRGDFIVHKFVPDDPKMAANPRAVIIFGSGDGGFDGWEDNVCHALQAAGYEMLGFDCAAYAKSDYDLATLQADMNTIAQSSLSRFGKNAPPLIIGGWSMGAEEAVPAAGGPHPPTGLVGLLLISPGDRGRYGIRDADRWDVLPTGPGTFALKDFAQSLGKTRVVQWSATLDPFGSKAWLSSLTAPYKSLDFPHGTHYYNGISEIWYTGPNAAYLKLLKESIDWILAPDEGAKKTEKEIRG